MNFEANPFENSHDLQPPLVVTGQQLVSNDLHNTNILGNQTNDNQKNVFMGNHLSNEAGSSFDFDFDNPLYIDEDHDSLANNLVSLYIILKFLEFFIIFYLAFHILNN